MNKLNLLIPYLSFEKVGDIKNSENCFNFAWRCTNRQNLKGEILYRLGNFARIKGENDFAVKVFKSFKIF